MVPIIVYLVQDVIVNHKSWARGFRQRFGNLNNYHPDPARTDPSLRKSGREIEEEILKEAEQEDLEGP